ncbi:MULTISPECIES: IS110 family transposase [unclassified Polaribacter]|uniref:IS110 family transposase n=1 Tax=unclassified Polaribacter TaxID=196858 RepID=UPI0011BD5A4D|nr:MULTISPECIES: IS110 family transposase [unclassified Polaribacter]TXD54061.1 IS110 family transposase [Polaribacter sp. IC063]TXD62577.1 IS110 family transposase [Polaribacter sp. IC066]
MKNYSDVIGIDVSKLTIDAHIHNQCVHRVFSNTPKGYKALLFWTESYLEDQVYFFCFENTGHYSTNLSIYLSEKAIDYVEESPLAINRSSGVVRGKTDKLDSAMIARYAWIYREELILSSPKAKDIQELGRLLSFRDQLVRNRTGKVSSLKEMENLLSSPSTDDCCKIIKKTIHYLTKQIISLENHIKNLMVRDESLQKNYELLNTLKGVGLVLSCQLLYHTSNFKRFDSWRQFSSYCGIAPFEHSSGTSIHRKNSIHHIGDRKMKTLLTLASVSAIQCDKELKQYYNRKVAEGKPKMVAINNVRNKILSRAFAVVKRGTPYVELQKFVA